MVTLSAARVDVLRERLNAFVDERDLKARIAADPVEFPHRYRDPRDVEVVALLSASLAYGRASLFKPKIDALLANMGKSPANFVANLTVIDAASLLRDFVYRFNVGADVATLLLGIGEMLNTHGSLEKLFVSTQKNAVHWRFGLADFSTTIVKAAPTREITKHLGKTRGLAHLLPSAAAGPAKRQHLFLRWLVRGPDAVDFGIWKSVDPASLTIPLDTHVARLSTLLGFTKRADISWRTADEVTAALRLLDPLDPTKYDFALCHYGMSGVCPAVPIKVNCAVCSLRSECKVGRKFRE